MSRFRCPKCTHRPGLRTRRPCDCACHPKPERDGKVIFIEDWYGLTEREAVNLYLEHYGSQKYQLSEVIR